MKSRTSIDWPAVDRRARECLRIAMPGGRYILASDHSLHDGIPVENITRMFDAGLKWGAYEAPI